MLTWLAIDAVSLSTFSLSFFTAYPNIELILYTLILFICGFAVAKLWTTKTRGKTFNDLLPHSLIKQWQAYDEWVVQTKKIFDSIEALRQSEERFRVIFEAAAIGISHTDLSGHILRANPKFCQIVGYSLDKLLSMRFQDITHPTDLLTELPLQQKLLKLEQNNYHIEKRYIRQDGTFAWIQLTVSVICNSKGTPIEMIKVIEDISDRKLTEEALKQQQLFNQKIQEANPNSLYIYDLLEQRNIYTNRHAAETLGYSIGEIETMGGKFLPSIVHPEDYNLLIQHIENIKSANENRIFEVEYRLKDTQNQWRWFRSRDTVFTYTEDNQPKQILGVAEEITYRKQAEIKLRASEKRYRELAYNAQKQAKSLKIAIQKLADTQAQLVHHEKMSSLGQLVAGVAHEINNPVSFIYGNINHIQEYAQDLLDLVLLYKQSYPESTPAVLEKARLVDIGFIQEDLPKILSSIKTGADRIREIVLSLRSFSRLDEAEMKVVNIHEGIDSALLILQSRLNRQANTTKIEVVKEYSAIEKIECYAGQLNQVFMNILNNAIDAINDASDTSDSCYQAKIKISTCTNKDNQVVVHITDNGCGMTEETRRRMYDPFFTTKPVGSGTGLGLAVSYKIIEKHGGKLECSSILGKGTKFTIKLPNRVLDKSQIKY
jgi:two-component system, NtrC family, sensor kinase